ncbi:hypothetical protein [Roseivivax sediminis]|uniref:Ribbon-helix-helix protein, copG family n=1 Tax=Roseivivax sediminis TaxID=936889 RepID=A0A1I1UKV4_9RHOB|nr:hypothetical protein [Roseivivax sediminis]SFD71441.1 hypothetical protein SAMN04515678_102400 [Roseivivax sediminis]
MASTELTIRLPAAMRQAAEALARSRDVSLGQVIRSALDAELRRAAEPAKTPVRADEQLLGSLRSLLARDFGEARSWSELQSRLATKGYALREAGGGLALHAAPDGARLCKASELGHAYRSLMRRFHAPFPGHAGHHRSTVRDIAPRPGPRDDPDDIVLIEPE